ncbi:hypothetical protein [Carnobacterium maltaromaticum]|uniref:hypothetical protein n=1 Tax=Carnobacterium maltaromaticum TaxID=2751 RepID=UPI00191BBDEA|nr:hypothetical protein [Carnobacterium maltaromaticum]CAD5898177.1 conserved hypothetical protein [Carnobacterium maltaromaticum]
MGFLTRFVKKIEKVNKGEASVDSLSEEMYIDSSEMLKENASNQWQSIAQTIIVNAVKATNYSVERAFILIDFEKDAPTFDIFYQENHKIIFWRELEEPDSQRVIETQLLTQAQEVVQLINKTFDEANLTKIRFAELQYKVATGAWFSHIIWSDSPGSNINKNELLNGWFDLIKKIAPSQKVDSDSRLPWYPS